jgi:glycine dehydrogenase subunit 2
MKKPVELLNELSKPGRKAYSLPVSDVPEASEKIPEKFARKKDAELPEVSEVDVVRHFTRLSQLNYAVDVGFYPLGSCTMKYNPKVNERLARLPGFANLHPYQHEDLAQGAHVWPQGDAL